MQRLYFLVRLWLTMMLVDVVSVHAQEPPMELQQQLENQLAGEQPDIRDEGILLQLEAFRKHPLNLNTAEVNELKQLNLLTDLQIAQLISYRNLAGKLIHIYELQAIPAWDLFTIRKVLPFIIVDNATSIPAESRRRFKDGEHSLLLRASQILERAEGFRKNTTGRKYPGSTQHLLFRYRYIYKNLLQVGMVGEKDAGEQFLKGAQRRGFDFYTAHLFARKIGHIESLAIGDFSICLGQGLIGWQGLAFKKGSDVMAIKRQSAVLRPYGSSGEFRFHRGAGVTVRYRKLEATVFASMRRIDGNLENDIDGSIHISSFVQTGNHRTTAEIEERNNVKQLAGGMNINYKTRNWQIGLNGIAYRFSVPVQKRDELYNLYAIAGTHWSNASIDYSYTYKNIHFFGEMAIDQNLRKATVNGLLMSADPTVDLALLYRYIEPSYQTIEGNAFTETVLPTNERGLYSGICFRPTSKWKLDMYADLYQFPWLKYRVDAPSAGSDYLLQLSYTPNKQAELYARFRSENKQANQSAGITVTNKLSFTKRQTLRVHTGYTINKNLTLRQRIEIAWFDKDGELNSQQGFAGLFDVVFKPMMKPFAVTGRLQYFETDDYDARIYAYENDILYSYTIPALSGKGWRHYLVFNYDLSDKLSVWLRVAQTVYREVDSIGDGADQIYGPAKTELKMQFRYVF